MNGKKGNDKYMNKVNTKLIRGGLLLQPQPERRKGYYLGFSLQKNLLKRRFNVRGGLIE